MVILRIGPLPTVVVKRLNWPVVGRTSAESFTKLLSLARELRLAGAANPATLPD